MCQPAQRRLPRKFHLPVGPAQHVIGFSAAVTLSLAAAFVLATTDSAATPVKRDVIEVTLPPVFVIGKRSSLEAVAKPAVKPAAVRAEPHA